ncbi:MAG: hypothetical protein EPN23_02250 [Verrucomicrobia bacterium]|nr:MAG: hypothetical protein EPN23_02250 [Verrucomicrobiota bacterium]
MGVPVAKIGIVPCSGEALPAGTVCRLACRRVLDKFRKDQTVAICLPLFIAGGEEERGFAARHPTITVDGCEKRCAAKATEMFSGKPAQALLIPDILGKRGISMPTRLRVFGSEEESAVQAVADEIAASVDAVLVQTRAEGKPYGDL